ncbi:MAG TPA: hypothetical protein DCL61_18075 [Cyanobacteria bacterium UBA12227]|nr:hypothetical protein [Cyanobacteria bacterium UBA12227]HAX86112.1 hypothetical protein [Cyanobacteria bacterium UBA11370]HBY81120.1 hypothetical protein [Cyanobacteria bacterium UBA11148]
MKLLKTITAIGGMGLVGLGASMALTNPSRETYEQYAVERLTTYLKEDVCTQAPKQLDFLPQNPEFLQRQCKSLVDTGRPQIRQIISQTTDQQDFILFTIYRTDLNLNPLLPAYHFETVGVFQNFYTYQANQQ